jgi:hypothetical protein
VNTGEQTRDGDGKNGGEENDERSGEGDAKGMLKTLQMSVGERSRRDDEIELFAKRACRRKSCSWV